LRSMLPKEYLPVIDQSAFDSVACVHSMREIHHPLNEMT
jgi:hypothetical protein